MLRLLALAPAIVALLAGLCAGLVRLGWDLPHGAVIAELHGALMISGLFGTLVSLERAVALGRPWAYAAPVLSGVGSATLLAGLPPLVGAGLVLLASGMLVAGTLAILVREPALHTATILAGAYAWLAGNLLWLSGSPLPDLVGWWLAFLVLTVGGERLELSRLMPPGSRHGRTVFMASGALLAAGALAGLTGQLGATLFGLGLLGLTSWLLTRDIARRNIRMGGQPRYMAACMLAGYVWLAVAGLVLLAAPPARHPFGYDVAIHAIALGFILSMVFGHALIILPAVVRVRLVYSALLYLPLALLHGSVALRVTAGMAEWHAGRLWSGVATIVALVLFAAILVLKRLASRPSGRLLRSRSE